LRGQTKSSNSDSATRVAKIRFRFIIELPLLFTINAVNEFYAFYAIKEINEINALYEIYAIYAFYEINAINAVGFCREMIDVGRESEER
jgi:hypothetical protein